MRIGTVARKRVWPGAGVLLVVVLLWPVVRASRIRPLGPPGSDRPGPDRPVGRASTGSDRIVAEGRVVAYPGAEVVVGTEMMGLIVTLPVTEKSVVKQGDLIAGLKADEWTAARAEALARIAEAEADIRLAEREVGRAERLKARQAGTASEVDTFHHNLEAARARCDAARAARERLDVLIARCRITSPIDGVVIARHAHPGEIVAAAARLVTVVDPSRLRIEAELDEFDAGRVALGSSASVTAEGYPGTTWHGTVEEIPDAVVGRRIRPEDPGRPTDLRVLLVKIVIHGATPLRLGQRVEVRIAGAPIAEP